MIWYKQGVVGDLSNVCQKALGRVAWLYKEVYNQDLFVTSKRDGNHSDGSLHYNGNAVDFRYPVQIGSDFSLLKEKIKSHVGAGFDVIFEQDHVHLEYDPK